MALTDAFLNVCRAAVDDLNELSAFRTAGALADETRAERRAQWSRLYAADTTGTSAADRLRGAIRATVNGQADTYGAIGSGVVGAMERETAYRTLIGEYVPEVARPTSDANELAALQAAIDEDTLR